MTVETHPAAPPSSAAGGAAAQQAEPDVSIVAPVVASHNAYLEEMTAVIREKTIPWEGYQRASLITEDDLAQIRQFEKSPSAAMAEAGEKYIGMFLALLQKLVRPDTIQSILILIDDLIGQEENAKVFYRLAATDPNLPFGPFTKLLKKDDEFIQLKAAKTITGLVLQGDQDAPIYDPSEIFAWITAKLQDQNANVVDTVVQILQSLLAVPSFRLTFYQTSNGMANLVDLLKKNSSNAQMQYQIIYSLWLLTFIKEIAADMQRKFDVLPVFIEIAKSAIKEKVIRVVFSTIRNMVSKAPAENLVAMLGNKLLQVCETLSTRKWSDTEIADDLEYIKEELGRSVQSLSTFDEYASEVRAGKLDWSPPHVSENFWKQNAAKLAEKDYELVRLVNIGILSRLISSSTNPLILQIAAHDVGQFVKHYPAGKKFIQEHGTKTQIMELMTHENQEVRYQALIAVQKLMTNAYLN
ncbi:H(+)-transporting V1 sector ATPase subunit H [Irineochytrium annulatum]|nr:H(+)-transporting V1 sector ATPase subunit H [Irineochytrium annulatum]